MVTYTLSMPPMGAAYDWKPKVNPFTLRRWALDLQRDAIALEIVERYADTFQMVEGQPEGNEAPYQCARVTFDKFETLIAVLEKLYDLAHTYYIENSWIHRNYSPEDFPLEETEALGKFGRWNGTYGETICQNEVTE